MDQTTRPKGCYSTTEMTVLSCLCSPIDVGSWREGGGKNLTTSASPSEMDSCGPEEVGAALSTPSPPGEVEERGRVPPSEKKEVRERLPLSAKPVPLSSQPKLQPPSVPAQPKLNGGQQAPAGVPPQFHPQFRGMMPPYVSDGLNGVLISRVIDFTWGIKRHGITYMIWDVFLTIVASLPEISMTLESRILLVMAMCSCSRCSTRTPECPLLQCQGT